MEIYTYNTVRIKISNNSTEESVTNQGVRQGCPFITNIIQICIYIYINKIKHWNEKYTTGMKNQMTQN
jgi:uncharacterized protein (DUF362 family)